MGSLIILIFLRRQFYKAEPFQEISDPLAEFQKIGESIKQAAILDFFSTRTEDLIDEVEVTGT